METKTCPACLQSIDVRAIKCSHCASRQPDAPMMHRDLPGRILGGVCSALALQFGWDPMVIRVLLVATATLSGGLAFWAYLLCWAVTPFEARGKAPATRLYDSLGNLFSKPAASSPPV
jgi:phage shock protein PspC (stress-responsive transcriptional regulator)